MRPLKTLSDVARGFTAASWLILVLCLRCPTAVSEEILVRTVELEGTRTRNGWTYYGGWMMPNSLAVSPAEDAAWIASSVGLVRYDLKTGQLRRWSTLDGLIDNYTHDIALDSKGNVWLATFSGISRFDGAKFTNWGQRETGHNWYIAVALDREGRLWAGCADRFAKGAVCLLPSGDWLVYNDWALHENGGFMNVVADIAPDPEGGVWLTGLKGGTEPLAGFLHGPGTSPKLYYIDEYGTANFVALPQKEKEAVTPSAICLDESGTLVLATWDGDLFGLGINDRYTTEKGKIPKLETAEWANLRERYQITASVGALCRDHSGRLWLATEDGLGRVQEGKYALSIAFPSKKWQFRKSYWQFSFRFAVLKDGKEALCFGHTDRGFHHWKDGKWTSVVNRLDGPGMPGRGFPIIGSTGRGPDGKMCFVRDTTTTFDGQAWTDLGRRSSLTLDKHERLKAVSWDDPDSKSQVILLSGREKPVSCQEFFRRPKFLPKFVDSRGHYWEIGTDLLEFTGKEVINHNEDDPYLLRPFKTYYDTRCGDIGEDAKGRIWLATQWGLLRHQGDRKWKVFGSKFGGMVGMSQWMWACNGIDTISFGGPWGSSDYNIPKNEWRNYTYEKYDVPGTIPQYPGTMVEYVGADLQGRMWYGFYEAGVCCRNKDGSLTHYTTADGLANNSVWGIWADDDGAMWFNTRAGTSRFVGTSEK